MVKVWDTRIPDRCVREFHGPSVSSDSLDLKDNILLVGNYTNQDTLQHWDFGSGKLIKTIDIAEP